jgi:hypothetical protein
MAKKTKSIATEPATVERSYFQRRIFDELGVTEETNRVRIKFFQAEAGTWQDVEYPIFREDSDGNILITPFTIHRQLIEYDSPKATPEKPNIENARRKTFAIKRLKTPEEYTDKQGEKQVKKYEFPKGTDTRPFITPGLIEKFERKAKIETLVLTEGYFKAFKGYLAGLDIVGLSSITHYKQKDTQTMYADVLEIIETCKVENVVMLYDGDARNISLKHLEAKKELRQRPGIFINSARTVRELFKDCKETDLYFAAVASDSILGNPKGLDDLYCALPKETEHITRDLLSFSKPATYFNRFPIKFDLGKLYKWFCLDTVENFYGLHGEIIGVREFVYNGTTYKYNGDKGTCDVMVPGEAKNYFRVGDDYYKFVMVPNKYQQVEKRFVRRLKTTIQEDHGKKFTGFVPKYESFCNVPDHTNYQQVFNNCFNVYAAFEHEPEEGDCQTILDFVRHIFGEHYELGLDYIQLLYQRPTQIMPILCLVSKQNSTGKSTFIKLLKAIFTQNCTIIGNDDLGNQFNGFWSTKLIVACEESFIEKKVIIEKIKALSTADKINMNKKGKDQDEIDFFAKFILASNNEDTFIFASRDDVRYWVRKVPVFSGIEKVNLLAEMIEEISAFLYFLNKRTISTKNESRMWFHKDLLRTDALDKLIHNSRPGIEKEIYEHIKPLFIEFGESEIYLTPTDINQFFIKKTQDISYLAKIFKEGFGVKPIADENGLSVVKSYTIPYWFFDAEGKAEKRFHHRKGRPFIFEAEKILDKYDLELWRSLQKDSPKPEAKQLTIPEAERLDFPNEIDIPF